MIRPANRHTFTLPDYHNLVAALQPITDVAKAPSPHAAQRHLHGMCPAFIRNSTVATTPIISVAMTWKWRMTVAGAYFQVMRCL